MPLIKNSSTSSAIKANIKQLLKDGKPLRQAVAISLHLAEKAKAKRRKRKVHK